MGYRVLGFKFQISTLGFGGWGSGFLDLGFCLGLGVYDFWVWHLAFGIWCFVFAVFGLDVRGLRFGGSGFGSLGFGVSDLGF